MRCREARNRIDLLGQSQVEAGSERELRDHLESCPSCTKYAELSGLLDTALAAARADDVSKVVPLELQRLQVERRIQTPLRQPGRQTAVPRWSALWSWFLRPGIRWGVSAAAVVLLALAFVPFTQYRTVGYNVSLDGVSRELALNHERICDLLTKLGLLEAGVDVIGCDTTCSVAIFDLKSEREAHLVVRAIARLGESDLTTNIVPIRAKSSRTLIEQANDLIRHGES